MGGEYSTHGRDEKCIQNLGRKPEGKRPLGKIYVDGKTIL
jgi:hypothetical protein